MDRGMQMLLFLTLTLALATIFCVGIVTQLGEQGAVIAGAVCVGAPIAVTLLLITFFRDFTSRLFGRYKKSGDNWLERLIGSGRDLFG